MFRPTAGSYSLAVGKVTSSPTTQVGFVSSRFSAKGAQLSPTLRSPVVPPWKTVWSPLAAKMATVDSE